jgi:hypothetical protein
MFKIFNIAKNTTINSDKPYNSNGLSSQGFVYSSSISPLTFYDNGNIKESRFLVDFDKNSINTFINGRQHDTKLILHTSRNVVVNSESNVVLYPLSKSFDEGYSENFIGTDGASWMKNTSTTTWDSVGGDYYTDLSIPNESITVSHSFPLAQYLTSSVYNSGLILISTGSGVVYTSYYTRHTKSSLKPYVVSFIDDYTPITGSSTLFNSGSIPTESFRLRPYSFNSALTVGNEFSVRFTFEHTYNRMTFAYSTSTTYVPNLLYSITDESTKTVLVDYNEKNKVYLNDGNYINFSTENFKAGVYSIKVKWIDGTRTWTSQPILFFLYE